MNLQIPNWIESLLIAVVVQALSAILNYLQGGQPFTWTGLAAAVAAALLSYATSAGWAKYVPLPVAPIVNVHVPPMPTPEPTQASVSMTVPPSATSSDSTTITATAGDVSVPVPPADAPQTIVSGAEQNTTPAIPSPVDAPQPVTSGDVASSSAAVEGTPARMVLIDGTPYVPASGVL